MTETEQRIGHLQARLDVLDAQLADPESLNLLAEAWRREERAAVKDELTGLVERLVGEGAVQ